jgi:hypothetical protein
VAAILPVSLGRLLGAMLSRARLAQRLGVAVRLPLLAARPARAASSQPPAPAGPAASAPAGASQGAASAPDAAALGRRFQSDSVRFLAQHLGFGSLRTAQVSRDGGVDFRGWWQLSWRPPLPVVGQCKFALAGSSVAVRHVRELEGTMALEKGEAVGVLVSSVEALSADAQRAFVQSRAPLLFVALPFEPPSFAVLRLTRFQMNPLAERLLPNVHVGVQRAAGSSSPVLHVRF